MLPITLPGHVWNRVKDSNLGNAGIKTRSVRPLRQPCKNWSGYRESNPDRQLGRLSSDLRYPQNPLRRASVSFTS